MKSYAPTDPELAQLYDEFAAAVQRKRKEYDLYRSAMQEHFAGVRTEASADRAYLRYREARQVSADLSAAVLRYGQRLEADMPADFAAMGVGR